MNGDIYDEQNIQPSIPARAGFENNYRLEEGLKYWDATLYSQQAVNLGMRQGELSQAMRWYKGHTIMIKKIPHSESNVDSDKTQQVYETEQTEQVYNNQVEQSPVEITNLKEQAYVSDNAQDNRNDREEYFQSSSENEEERHHQKHQRTDSGIPSSAKRIYEASSHSNKEAERKRSRFSPNRDRSRDRRIYRSHNDRRRSSSRSRSRSRQPREKAPWKDYSSSYSDDSRHREDYRRRDQRHRDDYKHRGGGRRSRSRSPEPILQKEAVDITQASKSTTGVAPSNIQTMPQSHIQLMTREHIYLEKLTREDITRFQNHIKRFDSIYNPTTRNQYITQSVKDSIRLHCEIVSNKVDWEELSNLEFCEFLDIIYPKEVKDLTRTDKTVHMDNLIELIFVMRKESTVHSLQRCILYPNGISREEEYKDPSMHH